MKSEPIINLERILDDDEGFFMKVRNLEGCDFNKLDDVIDALKEIKLFYANNQLVPKELMRLVIDMEPVLFGMIDSYPVNVRDQIFTAIDKLNTAINDCFK